MARLVECERPRRARTSGDRTRRTVRAHDRDLLRSRATRAHRQQGHALSAATRAVCAGVQGRGRVPFAAAGGAAHDLWRADTDRPLARLSRDVPSALAHRAGAADVAPGRIELLDETAMDCLSRNAQRARMSPSLVLTSEPFGDEGIDIFRKHRW